MSYELRPLEEPDHPSPHAESMRVAILIHNIDREWEDERARYTINTRRGLVIEPSYWTASIVAAVGVAVGLIGLFAVGDLEDLKVVAAGAGVFLLGGAGLAWHTYNFGKAHERYLERREAALRSARTPVVLNPDGEFRLPGQL